MSRLLCLTVACALLPWALADIEYYLTVSTAPPVVPPASNFYRSLASNVDDYPFHALPLSFPFPYYQSTRLVSIDPNGALHLQSPTPPCCLYDGSGDSLTCSFESPAVLTNATGIAACSLDTSVAYTNIIAPMLLDLDPTSVLDRSNDGIFFYDDGEALYVEWRRVPFYTSDWTELVLYYTFTVILHSDGTIIFHYADISDPTPYPEALPLYNISIARSWLVGLRQPMWLDTATAHMSDWSTTRPGTYPALASVLSNRTLTLCPFDGALCLYPGFGPSTGGTELTLSSPTMICANHYRQQYECVFTNINTTASVHSPAVYDNATNTLQCSSPPGTGTVSISLYDRTAAVTVTPDRPLTFTYEDTSYPSATHLGQYYCFVCGSVNTDYCDPIKDCNGVFGGSAVIDECGVCSGGNTGVALHSMTDCAGGCSGPGNIFTDTVNQCLCRQLMYPPVPALRSLTWTNASLGTYGAYIGPLLYHQQHDGFDAISECPVSDAGVKLMRTLDVLSDYQTAIIAIAIFALLFALAQAASTARHQPVFKDPFDAALFVPDRGEDEEEHVVLAAGNGPALVQEAGPAPIAAGEAELAVLPAPASIPVTASAVDSVQ